MDKVTHIYIYGDIINFQVVGLEEWGCVSLTTVKDQYDKNPDCEEIIVHLHSYGGDVYEGFAIHDFLVNTGKKVTTVVEGVCASIATVCFLAGSVRQMTENSRFLIHNPWTWADGNADELQAIVDDLRNEESKLVAFYVQKTGGDTEQLTELMAEDKFIDPSTALELKFATAIIDTDAASATAAQNSKRNKLILNSLKKSIKTNSKMKSTQKTKLNAILATANTLAGKIKTVLKAEGIEVEAANDAPQAGTTKLADGTSLYYEGDAALAVGDEVFVDAELTEAAEDGSYTAENNDTIVVTDGAVESITPEASAAAETAIVAQLRKDLKAATKRADENEALATQLGDALEGVNAAAGKMITDYKPKARTTTTDKGGAGAKAKPNEGGKGDLKAATEEFKNARKAKPTPAK